jgi:hypothetical protein
VKEPSLSKLVNGTKNGCQNMVQPDLNHLILRINLPSNLIIWIGWGQEQIRRKLGSDLEAIRRGCKRQGKYGRKIVC